MLYGTPLGKDKRIPSQYEIQMNSLSFTADMAFHIFPLHAYFLSLASFLYILLRCTSATTSMNLFHYLIRQFYHENHEHKTVTRYGISFLKTYPYHVLKYTEYNKLTGQLCI